MGPASAVPGAGRQQAVGALAAPASEDAIDTHGAHGGDGLVGDPGRVGAQDHIRQGVESAVGGRLLLADVQTGPADTLIQTVKKSDVKDRQPQPSSVMPIGLLNTLSKQQIFDLLAYLESSGANPQPHIHKH